MKSNGITIKHKEINSVIKKFRMLDMGLYLQSDNFKNLLNEFDFDLCWQMNINKLIQSKGLDLERQGLKLYENTLFQMLDNIWGCSSYEFLLISKQLLIDFKSWSSVNIDITDTVEELKKIEYTFSNSAKS